MKANLFVSSDFAAAVTRQASRQTAYTIHLLVDRPLVGRAYAAYAYFRWVDDTLDAPDASPAECSAFIARQKMLLERGYQGKPLHGLNIQESLLADLIRQDREPGSGLQTYLRRMMLVMDFDAGRRGRLISQAELTQYTGWLASAVTECMHYFIGHACVAPHTPARYQAVTAAHMTHMLRDTYDDLQAGYYNIPREVVEAHHITPEDVLSDAYRAWVQSRVRAARAGFQVGRAYLSRVANWRCRLAGFAYAARFEWLLNVIEREGYCLRSQYNENQSLLSGLPVYGSVLGALIRSGMIGLQPRAAHS